MYICAYAKLRNTYVTLDASIETKNTYEEKEWHTPEYVCQTRKYTQSMNLQEK